MKSKFILFLLLLVQTMQSLGQPKTITGRVIDEDGNPVSYATIFEKNTPNGTVADKDGYYKLEHVSRYSLVCSHITYETKTEAVSFNNKIVFILARHIYKYRNVAIFHQFYYRKVYREPVVPVKKDSLKKAQRIAEDEQWISRVEIPAVFPTGNDNLFQYFSSNILMDSLPFTNDFEGMIIVRFTVDKTGKAKDATILRGINNFADEATINAVNRMPLWEPAMQNGRNVNSQQEIAIHFYVTGQYPRE